MQKELLKILNIDQMVIDHFFWNSFSNPVVTIFDILKRLFNIFTKDLHKNNSEIMLNSCTVLNI